MTESVKWLQDWYFDRCNGDWEHAYGIKITTLDNPGWRIEIDLAETDLERLSVERVLIERSEDNWISYEVREQKFLAHGGPLCLLELIGIFRQYWEDAAEK